MNNFLIFFQITDLENNIGNNGNEEIARIHANKYKKLII